MKITTKTESEDGVKTKIVELSSWADRIELSLDAETGDVTLICYENEEHEYDLQRFKGSFKLDTLVQLGKAIGEHFSIQAESNQNEEKK